MVLEHAHGFPIRQGVVAANETQMENRDIYIPKDKCYVKQKVIHMNKIAQFLSSKKAQLGIIEFKYFMGGLVIGIIAALILAYLANTGVLPFKLSFLCPTPVK